MPDGQVVATYLESRDKTLLRRVAAAVYPSEQSISSALPVVCKPASQIGGALSAPPGARQEASPEKVSPNLGERLSSAVRVKT